MKNAISMNFPGELSDGDDMMKIKNNTIIGGYADEEED